MPDPTPPTPERELLNSDASRRLLARAAELDAEQRAGSELERLRAAAAEAGISASAFDAAVEEMRRDNVATLSPEPPRRPRRRRRWIPLFVIALIVGGIVMKRGAATSPWVVEETYTLRCLAAGDAAELVRPLLDGPFSDVRINPAQAPRSLRIRTTPEQMARVRALLDTRDAACVLPPTNR